jgi:hypothetical protein
VRRHNDRQVEVNCRRGRSNARLGVPTPGHNKLQEFAKLLDRKPGITRDTAHGDGVNRIVTRNGEDSRPIAHHDVLALTKDNKACLFKRSNRIEVIDARELGQD